MLRRYDWTDGQWDTVRGLMPMNAGREGRPFADHRPMLDAEGRIVPETRCADGTVNQVERFFAELTGKQLPRGVFRSVTQLRTTIRAYLRCHNAEARPFDWVADADNILRRVANVTQKMQRTSDSGH